MPSGVSYAEQQYHQQTYNYSFTENTHSTSLNDSSCFQPMGDSLATTLPSQSEESANSILQSVKEQEAQFERLTRELEAERQSVANQLERCKITSTSASMASLNSDSGRRMANQDNGHNESTPLVDSCLKVLQDRGIMQNGDEPRGRNVAFDSALNDNTDRTTASPRSSQNSYRVPGGEMRRSQANYSLKSYSNYASYPQMGQDGNEQGYTQVPLSDGDYVESSAAASYMNNYRDYQDSSELAQTNYQGDNQNNEQAINGDHIHQQYTGDYSEQPGYEENYDQQPEHVQENGYGQHQNYNGNEEGQHQNYNGNEEGQHEASSYAETRFSREHLAGSNHDVRLSNQELDNDYIEQGYGYSGNGNYASHQPYDAPPQDDGYGQMPARYGQSDYYDGQAPSFAAEPQSFDDYADQPPINASQGKYLYGSHQSLDSRPEVDQKWRPPELPEVIDYLSHPNDAIKANAAAYLQHLCYGNTNIKARVRSLGGIPALVELLHNSKPEVYRNALGCLLNLSRGYENDDNKRAIKQCGGLEALVKLLDRTHDNDARELISGILWNMSSLGELKRSIIGIALNPLMKHVIIPTSGITRQRSSDAPPDIPWSTEFRNSTGVLRNVSSDGHYARKSLRECDGLIEALLQVTRAVIGKAEMDNKPVENVVCTLRNLSFRLMEVDYPDYYEKKANPSKPQKNLVQDLIPGCFGKRTKKETILYPCLTKPGQHRGEQLWQPELADIYLPLLSDCSNTDTLEAAVGAVQNLTACEWQPSISFREHARRQKLLPTIVELLGLEEADNVVCGAAIALRNLAIDKCNKDLIGTFAISQLVSKLPPASGLNQGTSSEETIRAVLAVLYQVFKTKEEKTIEHAGKLVNDSDGLARLMVIAKSRRKYTTKTLRATHQILAALWRFSELREVYKQEGYKEADFLCKSMLPRTGYQTGTLQSMNSTLTRARSEPGSNTGTLNTIARTNVAYREDRLDERPVDVSESYLARHPSASGTLQIQRPVYHPPEENYQENPELYDEQPNANSYPQHNSNLYSQHPPTNDTYAKQTNGNYMDQPPVGDPYNNRVGSYRQLYNGDSYSEQLIPNSSYRQLDSAQLGYTNQA